MTRRITFWSPVRGEKIVLATIIDVGGPDDGQAECTQCRVHLQPMPDGEGQLADAVRAHYQLCHPGIVS